MTIRQKISTSLFVWIFSFLTLHYLTKELMPDVLFFLILIPALLFFSIQDRSSFLAFILLTLITAVYILFLAFLENWTTLLQMNWIVIHALFVLNIWSIYIVAKWTYIISQRNKYLSNRIVELEEHIKDTTILSKREFEKQKTIILTAMKRKNESGYLVTIGIENLSKRVQSTSFLMIAECVVDTIRNYYDIVGKIDDQTIIILLQNISSSGMDIVENRLNEKLNQHFTADALEKITFSIEEIKEDSTLAKVELT